MRSLEGIILLALTAAPLLVALGGDEVAAATLNPGDILVTDRGSSIIKIDPVTGAHTLITIGGVLDNLFGLAVDAQGQIVVASLFVRIAGFPPGVGRVDPETGAQTILTTGGFILSPMGIAIEADGHILVTDNAVEGVIRIDPVTGAQSLVTGDALLGSLTGITVVGPLTKTKKK